MPEYRRCYEPGGTFFFTLVTHCRRPILATDLARRCLREAINDVRANWPFAMVAIVLLPNHLHALWTLPPNDSRYPIRWKRIKEGFTRRYLEAGGEEIPPSISRLRHGERGVWERRYWEHTVRDEDDLKRCVDYVHWNPKKHGYVANVRDWQWSSFHRFVAMGEYTLAWGEDDPTPGYDNPEWGE
jgi:putative transposase